MILGLLGRAGHGKTTVARWLAEHRGFEIVSLAAPLKRVAQTVMGFSHAQLYGSQAEKDAIDPRYGMSAREFLQRLGTEGMRAEYGDDVHVRAMLRRCAPGGRYVCDDVRFSNEVAAINGAGGAVIRIVCTDAPATGGGHSSEAGVDAVPESWLLATVTTSRAQGVEHLIGEVGRVIQATVGQRLALTSHPAANG